LGCLHSALWLGTGGARGVTLNYLIPDDKDEPLIPRQVFVAGINHVGICDEPRQKIIATLHHDEPIYLVRMPNNPHDPNAVALFRGNGEDIGYLTRELAAEIAPRLDQGSPVTATVEAVEPFETEAGRPLLGVRLLIVPYRLKRR
jgi:hypothetical protein